MITQRDTKRHTSGTRIDAPMFVKAFFSSFWKSARSWFC